MNRGCEVLVSKCCGNGCCGYAIDLARLLEVVVEQNLNQLVLGRNVVEVLTWSAGGNCCDIAQLVNEETACRTFHILVGASNTGNEPSIGKEVGFENRRISLVYVLIAILNHSGNSP